jgi:alpha-tubulin suppressor-like RCC1 family protein
VNIYLFIFVLSGFHVACTHHVLFYLFSRGDFGRLGHGNSSDLFTPQPIKALHGLKIKQIACGDSHCLAVTVEGEVQRLVIFPKFSLNLYFEE